MPPRPFPFPINIGTDICSTKRIFQILTARRGHGDSFLKRVLNEKERESLRDDKIGKPLRMYWETRDRLQELRVELKRGGQKGIGRERGHILRDSAIGREALSAGEEKLVEEDDSRSTSTAAKSVPSDERIPETEGAFGRPPKQDTFVDKEEAAKEAIHLKEELEKQFWHVEGSIRRAAEWLAGRQGALLC